MKKHVSADFLKFLAIITMIIDHVGLRILNNYLKVITNYEMFTKVKTMYEATRIIGRIAFPIFCYQLIQGFYNTRSRKKYAANLFVFALISEVPFDLMTSGKLFDITYQNVMWTLLIGFLAISIFERLSFQNIRKEDVSCEGTEYESSNKIKNTIIKAVVAVCCIFTANILRTDYKGYGVLLIIVMYIFYTNREKLCLYSPFAFVTVDLIFNLMRRTEYGFLFGGTIRASVDAVISAVTLECYSFISFYFIYFDNGIRKFKGKIKYLFYLIYPAHMIVIYFVSTLIK